MLPHHGLIFLNEFDEDQTKIVDLSLFLCLWDSLIFKVSTKNQSMHEIEKTKLWSVFQLRSTRGKCISAFSPQAH